MNQLTLVFLHGWCCEPKDFHYQVAYYANNHPIVMPNYTEWLKTSVSVQNSYLSGCLAQLRAVLEKITSPYCLIGHSMGGVLAILLAKEQPHLLQKLVLVDTSIPVPPLKFRQLKAFFHSIIPLEEQDRLTQFLRKSYVNPVFDNAALMKAQCNKMTQIFYSNPNAFSHIMVEAIEAASSRIIKTLATISVPISYLSSVTTHADLSCLRQVIPDIDIHTFNAGHFIMLNKPKEFNKTLDTLIKPK